MESDLPKWRVLPGLWTALRHGTVIGLSAGLVIACFRTAHDWSVARLLPWLASYHERWWIIPLWACALLCLTLGIGLLVRRFPLISGSGIPQTELALRGKLTLPSSLWPKILVAKWIGSWLAVFGGLSVGREGPCVQIGGAVGAMWGDRFGHPEQTDSPYLMAGAASGLAAAFSAPCAGLIFVFEEMKSRITAVNALIALAAAFCAQIMVGHVFGLGQIFSFSHFAPPEPRQLWTLIPLGVLMGLFGVLYNTLLLRLRDADAAQTALPPLMRSLTAFTLAGFLAFTFPQVLGGGDGLIAQAGTTAFPLRTLGVLLFLKFAFSLVSVTGGVPGGLLMPLLCIGALAGNMFGLELAGTGLITAENANSFMVFGMAGLFTAIVRAPLTGIALVMEMSGALACLPGACVVAFIASGTASLLNCAPIYDSLKERVNVPEAAAPEKA